MKQQDLRKVVAWMMGTLMSFSGLAISVRELSGQLDVFEILALRAIGGIVILGGYALLTAPGELRGPRPLRLHLLRNSVHFAGQAAWAFGLTVLPLATVFALEFTTPAWTVVLAVLFLHERISVARVGAVVLGLVGVLVILRPGASAFRPEALLVLFAAVMFAIQLTTTKFLTGSNSVLTILFWMNVMQLPLFLGADAAVGGSVWIWPKLHAAMLPALTALWVSGLLAHVCLTNAFRHGEAIVVVPIDFLRIPFIAVVGVIFYHEAFDPMVLLGAAISASGIIWSLRDRPPPR
jgi:drug/metabolite transporter (DMT)-like permease